MLSFPSTLTNDATRKGELAAKKQLFGEFSRYAVAPVHSRFGELTWFVWDAAQCGDDGYAEVIRQEPTLEEAIAGLD